MNKDNKGMATSVRFDEKTAMEIKHLSDASRMSQSDVIRHLIGISLKDRSKFVLSNQTVLSDEDKTMLLSIAEKLASINTAINKIGSLINVRRRSYNTDRKVITDKIQALNQQLKNASSSYDKIKLSDEITKLQSILDQFNENAPSMIEADDWTRFEKIKDDFKQLTIDIGRRLESLW